MNVAIKTYLNKKLQEIVQDFGCELLWVAERSSRVWGTAGPDSDFDIKVIYKFPSSKYVGIIPYQEKFKRVYGPRAKLEADRSVYDIEISGFDVRVACKMIVKNDPNMLEMLTSTIVYKSKDIFLPIANLAPSLYNHVQLATHYYNWSFGHTRWLRTGKRKQLKKRAKVLTYIIRGVLSVEWLMRKGTAVGMPLEVEKLMEETDIAKKVGTVKSWGNVLARVRSGNKSLSDEELAERLGEVDKALLHVCPEGLQQKGKRDNEAVVLDKLVRALILTRGNDDMV